MPAPISPKTGRGLARPCPEPAPKPTPPAAALAAAALVAAAAGPSLAAPVPVSDHSFEEATLGGQTWSDDLGAAWSETGGPSAPQGFVESIDGFAADGSVHVGMTDGHDVWQDVGATFQAATTYTLTVAAGNRAGFTNGGNESTYAIADSLGAVYASGSFDASTLAEGTFADAPAVSFSTTDVPAAVGRSVRVLLQARGGGRSHFDHVRLDSEVEAAPAPPVVTVAGATTVGGSSAALAGAVTDAGNEAPAVTVYFGISDGGTSAAAWDRSVAAGDQAAGFTVFANGLEPTTTYFYRAFAENSAGSDWSDTAASFTTTEASTGNLVINEIHYNDDDNTSFNEFVELVNAGDSPADISGWRLRDAVDFTFPPGTTVPGNGFVVVAEVPANVPGSIGPYAGRLSGRGERVELVDGTGTEVDQVDYKPGFPWPTRAGGGGSSMELINPSLDNDLGSSWRSSATGFAGAPATFILPGATWRYRRGDSEASDPASAWRGTGFAEDGSWRDGATPVGFGDGDDETDLSLDPGGPMQNNYASVYLRKTFTVSGDVPTALTLRLYYDDGAVVWINGTEVARTASVSDGEVDHRGDLTGSPTAEGGGAVSSHEADTWEEFALAGSASYLVQGTNVVAVHALNDSLGSSDFSIDLELRTPPASESPAPPSPGAPNGVFSLSAPPNIRQVRHAPHEPTGADEVVVTAKVTDPEGVAAVTLEFQTVQPGGYIRLGDAGYETGWTSVPMNDEGNGGDAVPGDDTYSATLPATTHSHRWLVRYRIAVSDTAGSSATAPFPDDGQRNFAYFVYDGIPSWTGADRPGTTAPVTFPAELMDDLPVYHLIADGGDVQRSQYSSAFQHRRFQGTFVYEGVVYDNIEFNNRGEASTYQSGKNKWRIHFNRARDLAARDNYGELYDTGWDELNINANASPWAPVHRGMAGIDEAVTFRLYELLDVPSSRTHYFHYRVVDSADEAPTGSTNSQYTGDLWGLYLAVEHPDGSFLDDRDLPDGNVYKLQSVGEKKHQGATQPLGNTDWRLFDRDSTRQTPEWWRANMHLPTYYSFRAGNRICGNVDIRNGFNHYLYHSPVNPDDPSDADGLWYPMPWDLDMMYIAETHWAGVIKQEACLANPEIALEFRNRCRELLDLMCADGSAAGGQIGQLVHEYATIVNPAGPDLTWADIDQFMWNWNPNTPGNPNSHTGQGNHRGNFFWPEFRDTRIGGNWDRTLPSPDHEGSVQWAINYMTDTDDDGRFSPGDGDQDGYGYNYLELEASDGAEPERPEILYSGTPGFPSDGLSFEASPFADPQGAGTFAAVQWRIGEINAPGVPGFEPGDRWTYEIEDNYTTGALTDPSTSHSPPASATRPGRTYRARVRYQDDTGRWSRWSEPVEFAAAAPDVSTLQRDLVISEVHYNPDGGDDTEFIEIHNRGSAPLDLTDVRFTKGIDFDFADGSSIAAGAYLVVARDLAGFTARYGGALPVAGEYGGNDEGALDNDGETVKLALGTAAVHEFTYGDDTPWPEAADGDGYSMVLAGTWDEPDPALPDDPLGHGDARNWRPSTLPGGNPGRGDSTPFTGDPDADGDGDGLSAILEHALGTSDSDAGSGPMAFGVTAAPDGTLVLYHSRNLAADDVSLVPQASTALTSWAPATAAQLALPSEVPDGTGLSTVGYTITASPAAAGDASEPTLYFRFGVEPR